MAININDKLWTQSEREEIIEKAAANFESSKRRVRRVEEPPEKIPRIELEISDDDDESSELDSESEVSEDGHDYDE
jgi:hypothetical protein